MKSIRPIFLAALAAGLLLVPVRVDAQLSLLGPCSSGVSTCSPFGFEFFWATRPIELADVRFELMGGWQFGGGPVLAEDLFGPFPGLATPGAVAFGGVGGGGGFSSLRVDFLTALFGPIAPAPGCGLDPFSPCEGFAVAQAGSPFDGPTFLSTDLTPPSGADPLAFDWSATDIDGTTYSGSIGPRVSVPEPSSWLLLLTGILGMGLVEWKRRREGQEV